MTTDVASTPASTHLGGISNLALMAPIKPGFVDGIEAVTYTKRLEILLTLLNAARLTVREVAWEQSPFPDLLGSVGILRSFRYAIVSPDIGSAGEASAASNALPGAPPTPGVHRLSLNVSFDGGWESYMRVIHRDLGPLLDAILCHCEGYPLARANTYETYTRWVRAHDFSGGLFYTGSDQTVMDQAYHAGIAKIQRESADPVAAELACTRYSLKDARAPFTLPEVVEEAITPEGQASVKRALRLVRALDDMRPIYPTNDFGDDKTLQNFAFCLIPPQLRGLLKLLAPLVLQHAQATTPGSHPNAAPPASAHSAAPSGGAADAGPDHAAKLAQAFGPLIVANQSRIGWLTSRSEPPPPPTGALADAGEAIQAGIVSRQDGTTHGCLVLLQVTDAAKAREKLKNLPVSADGATPLDVQCNVALSAQGLKALGLPQSRIDKFPREFIDGMEARAGLLGDVRCNHPVNWHRPRQSSDGPAIELSSVHAVVQWRLMDETNPSAALHADLEAMARQFDAACGFRVLAVEPMRSYPEKVGLTREHFGFRDGFSQPVIQGASGPAAASGWRDSVPRGELLLGHANDRGDPRFPTEPDPLMDNGSFLVVRKIRQHVGLLESVLQKAAEAQVPAATPERDAAIARAKTTIKSKMMGRDPEGQPLMPVAPAPNGQPTNDFDFGADPDGDACPFQAHVRRTNPRTHSPMPRMMRRGMSYGPRGDAKDGKDGTEKDAERGLFFMAYCASIAEQFEIVQRWVAGGNSSGVSSSQHDPLLGVPQEGEARIFKYVDNDKVCRIDLGNRPFTELQWGLYLFTPSLKALRTLDDIVLEQPVAEIEKAAARCSEFTRWQRLIGDRTERDGAWKYVRENAGQDGLHTAYGDLVATRAGMLAVLQDETRYSVRGYGERLGDTVGLGFLGLDRELHAQQAETPPGESVNEAIESISEEAAFAVAVAATTAALQTLREEQPPDGATGNATPIDIARLSQLALASMCTAWFGLPNAESESGSMPARDSADHSIKGCPAQFFSIARYVFWPHPSDAETREAKTQGLAIRNAVTTFLASAKSDPAAPQPGPLAAKVQQALALQEKDDPGIVARTLAGVMLGFPPTVHLNFVNVMRGWIANAAGQSTGRSPASLWDLQAGLVAMERKPATHSDYAIASEVLRSSLLAQMADDPAPEVLWRRRTDAPADDASATVVLGIAGVMQDRDAHHLMMFGGARAGDRSAPAGLVAPHACPGTKMAIGVLLGMTSSLLRAGTLRATGFTSAVDLVKTAPPEA